MLRVASVSRTFGDRQVLRRRLVRRRQPGRMTGFVGANGAGKTTTMRIILGRARRRTRARSPGTVRR